ncbi:hypothetical protein BaRGS_00003616 [Batillaria attramentaria]|uniref:Hydroxymethylglutaryl-CoA synthase n=1 Tax=Batillaria attramentaria TaxID=370345 RepID=A0ABD0M029_9CAEN
MSCSATAPAEFHRDDGPGWPKDVGIVAMEIYFPSQYVEESELERYDGVPVGKYTADLEQCGVGFISDREDVHSMGLTVLQRLVERQRIPYTEIGCLEVGTATLLDQIKSVKSVLMQLFEDSGNTDVEGVDATHSCVGGTAALVNAVNWVESSAWDGRYAVVVTTDVASYASRTRSTGSAGAVAMLIGPNAALVLDRGVRSYHIEHNYDFFKPDLASWYPVVDTKLEKECSCRALDRCYQTYRSKAGKAGILEGTSLLDMADAFILPKPCVKSVRKTFARVFLNDFLTDPDPDFTNRYAGLEAFREVKLEETYQDRELQATFMAASQSLFETKTQSSTLLIQQVGYLYTPTLFNSLASYVASNTVDDLAGKRVVMFIFGAGAAGALFSLRVAKDASPGSTLQRLVSDLSDLRQRLDARQKAAPEEFDKWVKLREQTQNTAPYTPTGSVDVLLPGTWYLTGVDSSRRRTYKRKPLSS